MRLRWEHIDPQIAARVGAELAHLRSEEASPKTTRPAGSASPPPAATQGAPATAATSGTVTPRRVVIATANARPVTAARATTATTATQTTAFEQEPLNAVWNFLALCVALLVVLLYMSICFHLTGPAGTFALTAAPVGLIAVGCLPYTGGMRREGRARKKNVRLRGPLPASVEIQRALTRSVTTRAERLYGEVVLLLLAMSEQTRPLDNRLRRDLLRQCNQLLSDHLRIEAQCQRVRRMVERTEPLDEWQAERRHLAARMDAETDPIARQSLTHSLELCDERGESVRSLGRTLTRLDAHNEVICQALSLARTVLTQAQAVPSALNPPDVSSFRAAVRRVATESRAVEEAVDELSRL